MSFGTLLILDCKDCDSIYLDNKEFLQFYINELIKIMNMSKVGNTVFEYFEPNEFNIKNDLVGYSITQIISLSSITIHICEGSKNVYIDIFTCSNIDDNIFINITNLTNKIFNPNIINKKIINR